MHFHGKNHFLTFFRNFHSDFTKFFFSSDEVLLISKLNSQAITLKIILPFVIASLIKGAGNNTTSIIIDGTGNFSLLQFSMYNYICNISDFTKKFLLIDSKFDPDFVVIDQNTESLKEYLSREWYESWSQLGN